MSKDVDLLVNNFLLYFPTENVHGIEFDYNENFNPFELLIKYPDGTVKVYDDSNRSIRIIYFDQENISDEAWKKEFARRVKWKMRRKGYTQEELAEELGTTQAMISGYLNGKNIPSFRFVTKLAKILDCTPNDLYIK